tara:strand:- start:48 stop:446 length:399 start_codon:yes stop_codon:yes gene_type:complete
MKHENLLTELIKIQNSEPIQFSLMIDGTKFLLSDAIISEKSTPVTKKTVRGGVYFSDKFVYQIKAAIFDSKLANSLSDTMLGPSFEFKDLEICVDNVTGKWKPVSIIVNLVNSVQKQSKTELTMNIIKIYKK